MAAFRFKYTPVSNALTGAPSNRSTCDAQILTACIPARCSEGVRGNECTELISQICNQVCAVADVAKRRQR